MTTIASNKVIFVSQGCTMYFVGKPHKTDSLFYVDYSDQVDNIHYFAL